MALSTSTGSLAVGASRTFNLSPGSALTLVAPPNCRVTVTETPNTVSASGVGGNASRVHNLQLPQTVTYGPYPMGGTVVVANASNSGSVVTCTRSESDGSSVPIIPATRPRLLIVGNSIAGQSCRGGASYTSRVATAAGSGVKPGNNQITLLAGGVAALSLSVNDYIVVQTANQQPWPVQVTAISTETLTLAKRLPWAVRTVSGSEAGVSKVTSPILFGGTWRQTFGIHNYANALAGGLFEIVPGYGHGSATAAEILAVLPQHLQFYRPAVVMLSLFENDVTGSLTAAQMIALADQAAILCTSAGARPIVLHSLPTFSLGGGREDEYDDLKAGILAIATRVPGAIGKIGRAHV